MDKPRGMPRFLHVTGSAAPDTDPKLLRLAHAFAESLVRRVLHAGAGFTLFLGPEPVAETEPALPIVFDGTVLRAVAAFAEANPTEARTLLRVVAAPKHLERHAPRQSVEVLMWLLEQGVAKLMSIPDDDFEGGVFRDTLLDHCDAIVGVSGGKGVRSLSRLARARGTPMLPVPIALGSSLSDGGGAAALYREFCGDIERFLPASAPAIAEIEPRLSLTSPLGGPETVADTVWAVLNQELTQAARQRLHALIVTVLPVELQAAARALDIDLDQPPELTVHGTAVWRAVVDGAGGSRNVALTCLGSAGNVTAGVIVAQLVQTLSPSVVVVSGIAAGRRGKLKLGDCVVAERVVAYEGAADKDSGMARRPSVPEVSHDVRQFLTAHLANPELSVRLQDRFERAGGAFPAHEHGATGTSLQLVTLAAGEKLLRRAGFWDELAALHDKIEVAEMEGHGVAVAASLSKVRWLVVRGVSDFGDAEKNDVFHGPAALVAACAAVDLVARLWD